MAQRNAGSNQSDSDAKNKTGQNAANPGNAIGTEGSNVGGNLAENNDRGSGQRSPQGEGKVNAGTDIPAQGIDNANKEAQEDLRKAGGENRIEEGPQGTAGSGDAGAGNTGTGEQRSAFDGGKTQEQKDASRGQRSLMDEATELGQNATGTTGTTGTTGGGMSNAERRLRPNHNPSGHGIVSEIKRLGVDLFNLIEGIGATSLSDAAHADLGRWKSMSLTSLEESIDKAEKAASASIGK